MCHNTNIENRTKEALVREKIQKPGGWKQKERKLTSKMINKKTLKQTIIRRLNLKQAHIASIETE